MTGYDDFETRLERALRGYGDQALAPFDPDLIAERAIGAPRPRSVWRALLVTALLLALLVLATAGIITLTRPEPTPNPSPRGELSSAMLRTETAATSVQYRVPEGLNLASHQEWSNLLTLTPDDPGRGVVIADVTFFSVHDGGQTTTSSATEFLEILDRSDLFLVIDEGRTTIGSRPARHAVIEAQLGFNSHIDLFPTATTVEFGYPNVTSVVEVNQRIILIQIWAKSEDLLSAWMPDALRLVDTVELSPGG
jgi:hypothetical protein